jgi:hypothetical protein
MTLYETLTLLMSLLALAVSTVSLVRGRKLGQVQEDLANITSELALRQIDSLEIAKQEKAVPLLGVHITSLAKTSYFIIANTGQGSAFDVDLELIDCPDNPLVTAGDLLPCPELKPRSTVKLLAVFHNRSPLRYQVKLRWTTESRRGESEVFWVSQA